ncbi:type I-E CRISPR-associated protein Cse2/CasB [Streptomyces albipurpureus]|uniref:Type I-E CRISPR-associated protein Cse2/CasB n=1 Tax=Streptomyces albipurpureus TaxID=2897419 RepID=A0ABT0UXA3_9ACTN|nr:type I-E CRISPR-associated protein Cse2/CasB [Streptomyces sp. CWNU-1]MCM2393032.1 type I-E CRISPR-associated protein Cse2/CasB [Streptomyces sp. CWNU-1]
MPTNARADTDTDTAARVARRYWNQHVTGAGNWRRDAFSGSELRAAGEDLAALRSGLGRPAATVPALWRYYTSPVDGRVTPELEAEHAALALYGLHQQSQSSPMHRRGVTIGTALRALHRSGRFSEEAVDRRVAAAVHTTAVPALLYRLRGLVTQLRAVQQPIDYDQLLSDVWRWSHPEHRQRVRREWGLAYHAWGPSSQDRTPAPGRPASPDGKSTTTGTKAPNPVQHASAPSTP